MLGVPSYQGGWTSAPPDKNDNDTRAYQQGKATITPLKLDWTNHDLIENLKQWELSTTP